MATGYCFGVVRRLCLSAFFLFSLFFGLKSHSMEAADCGAGKVLTASVFSPERSRSVPIFSVSPASQSLSFVIYLIHDAKDPLPVSKVDFESKEVSGAEFAAKVADLESLVSGLKTSGDLERFHRYIGYVSQVKRSGRTAATRFLEHVRDCNSSKRASERRLYQGLRRNAKGGITTRLTVLAHNIHPHQIKAVEAYFIRLFDGLNDLGWNSCAGDVSGMSALCASSVAASAGVHAGDDADDGEDVFAGVEVDDGDEESSCGGALTFEDHL